MDTSLEKTMNTAWQKSKWIVKGCIIGLLALMMMIPMLYVKSLIHEREERQQEATREITSKWAGPQNIIGPVLSIPYWESDPADSSRKTVNRKHIACFLPDTMNISATVNPREKHRGIFKVMLYDSKATISGSFKKLAFDKLDIRPEQFIWNEAFVTMSIADPKGLNEQLLLKWKGNMVELSPSASDENKMTASLNGSTALDFENVDFSTTVDINGSERLFFTPIGKTTTVTVHSPWKDPSFSGSMLPQKTDVRDTGFDATWKSMSHKRSFPQQWKDNDFRLDHQFPTKADLLISPPRQEISVNSQKVYTASSPGVSSSSFGVDLFIPVNGYQKTLRTIKYALLCIVLTFAAFFLIESSNKKSAHPFQYGLIGLALILFYTLLLSISEYTGFNAAYIISSLATVGLIAWFVKGILQSGKATTILSVVLMLIYSYVFSLLQLQDYSLLLGSIGLFLTLAVVMYFSKKLQW